MLRRTYLLDRLALALLEGQEELVKALEVIVLPAGRPRAALAGNQD